MFDHVKDFRAVGLEEAQQRGLVFVTNPARVRKGSTHEYPDFYTFSNKVKEVLARQYQVLVYHRIGGTGPWGTTTIIAPPKPIITDNKGIRLADGGLALKPLSLFWQHTDSPMPTWVDEVVTLGDDFAPQRVIAWPIDKNLRIYVVG